MSTLYELAALQNKLYKQSGLLSYMSKAQNVVKDYHIDIPEELIKISQASLKVQNSYSATYIANIKAMQNNVINLIPKDLNVAFVKNISMLNKNISTLLSSDILNNTVPNSSEIIDEIKDCSNYIQEGLINSSNDKINDKVDDIKDLPKPLVDKKEVNWISLIPIILSLISLLLTAYNIHENNISNVATKKYEQHVSNSLDNISKNIEQQTKLLIKNNK